MEFGGVDIGTSAVADPHPLTGEKIDEALQEVLHLAIDLAIRIVEHYRNAVVGERITARLG